MFRFGLKEEEKDMLNRTINELQELRTELAGLVTELVRMMPVNREAHEEYPAEDETFDGEDSAINPDLPWENEEDQDDEVWSPEEFFENDVIKFLTGHDDQGECLACAAQDDLCGGQVQVNEMLRFESDDEMASCNMQDEGMQTGRNWAVVNLNEKKKSWWRIWGG